MEISQISEEEKSSEILTNESHKIDLKIAEVEFALEFLKDYAETYKGVEGLILGEKTKIDSLSEVEDIRQNFVYNDVVEIGKNIEEKQNKINTKLADNSQIIETLTPWKKLDINLKGKLGTERTKLILGFLKNSQAEECLAEFENNFTMGETEIVEEFSDKVACWFIVEKSELREVETFLQKYEFSEFVLPKLDGTTQEILADLEKKQIELNKELEKLNEQKRDVAKDVPKLKIIFDYLNWVKSKEEIKQNFDYTDTTATITGFVPNNELKNLETELEAIDKTIVVETLEITEEDDVPVELGNTNTVKPFEGVMKLFGLPSSSEIDPTPYLTPFFLIFFGFCLTDVGYGLILGLGIMALLKFVKFPNDMKNMLRLLMYAGWSTVVMGILFGGYFGLTVEQAPDFMVNAETGRFKLQVFDPINNLNAVMGFAYGLGLFQLWLGTLLKGINTAKTDKWEAFQTSFSYNVLILIIIFFTLAKTEILFAGASGVLEKLLYVNIVFSIWGSGFGQKNIIVRPLIGAIVFIQEIINIFSAILSYSRLFALGLSTGIIALVFNTIAITTLDLLPIFIAIPAMIVIILLGHTLNIGLNVLGAFIHSARLQFVEFFGKFLTGGGKTFTPFKKEMRYIALEED